MLKRLLSNKRILGVVVCALVLVVAFVVYQGSMKQQAHRDIRRTEKSIKERQPRETGSRSAESGHYHSDGTYHTGSHETTSGTTAPSAEGKRSGIDPERVIWTGKPLREVSAPDPLSPAERKARNAKIQALNTEIEQLWRVIEAQTVEWNEHVDKYPKISRERRAILAEMNALPTAQDWTAEERARYNALSKRFEELDDLSDKIFSTSDRMQEENRLLLEKRDALEAELSALRRQ